MSESVTIGDQSFIKDPAKGWIDKKTKQPADKGLLRLLDSLDIQPVQKRLKVDIDNTIEPITLSATEKYVFDKNSGWVDAKTKKPAAPDMLKLLDSLKSKINIADDTSKPTTPKPTPKAKPKPKKPAAAKPAEPTEVAPEPEEPVKGSKFKALAKGFAGGFLGSYGIDLQKIIDEKKEKKDAEEERLQEIKDTYYSVEESETGVKKYRDAKTGRFISAKTAADYDILAQEEFKKEKRKKRIKDVGKGFAGGFLGSYGIDLQKIIDEKKAKKEAAAKASGEEEPEVDETKKGPAEKGPKSLDKPSISALSNSFTNLITAFNGMDTYSKNINAIFKAQQDAKADVSKENILETDITPAPVASGGGDSSSEYLASALPGVTAQLDTLTELINGGAIQGSNGSSGFDPTDLLDFGKKGRGAGRFGRFARFAAPAVAAAAATGAILYGTDKYIKNTNVDARNKQDSGISQFGITGDNFEGFVINGKNVGGRENLPEYYKNVVDGYGANNRGGSAERARQYVETHNPDGSAKQRSTPKGAPAAGSDAVKMMGASPLRGEGAAVKQQTAKASSQATSVKEQADKAEKQRQNILSGKSSMLGGFGSKIASWMGSTFQNVTEYVSHIPERLAALFQQGGEYLASGMGVGTSGYAEANLGGARGEWTRDAPFITGVNALAQKWNIDAGDLLGMMHAESGIQANIQNSIGATGLIQFMPSTARAMGTTVNAIKQLNRTQQLPLVDQYFTMNRLPRGATAGQLYASVFWPAALRRPSDHVIAARGSRVYSQNAGLDVNRDGSITVGDLTQRVSQKRQEIGLGPSNTTGGFRAFANIASNVGSNVVETATSAAGSFVDQITAVPGNLMSFIRLNSANINLNGLVPGMTRRFTAMAAEFNQRTGRKIGVNSAYRSPQEQAALFRRYGSPRAARPGSSRHEVGLAMDINSVDGNALDQMGLLNKYGFIRPVRGEAWHIEPVESRNGQPLPDNPYNPGQPIAAAAGSGAPVNPASGRPAPRPAPARPSAIVAETAHAAIDTAARTADRAIAVSRNAYNSAASSARSAFNYLTGGSPPPPPPARRRNRDYQQALGSARTR